MTSEIKSASCQVLVFLYRPCLGIKPSPTRRSAGEPVAGRCEPLLSRASIMPPSQGTAPRPTPGTRPRRAWAAARRGGWREAGSAFRREARRLRHGRAGSFCSHRRRYHRHVLPFDLAAERFGDPGPVEHLDQHGQVALDQRIPERRSNQGARTLGPYLRRRWPPRVNDRMKAGCLSPRAQALQ